MLLIIRARFWSSYYKIRAKPHSGPKYGQFAKHSHGPFIHRFPLVYFCVLCTQHFKVLTVKFLLNQITTHKMASLENIVTRGLQNFCHTPLNYRYRLRITLELLV